jgi:hypothetical protein
MLRSKMADLEVRIAELQALQVTLSHYLSDCERTLGGEGARRSGPDCPVIETLRTEQT